MKKRPAMRIEPERCKGCFLCAAFCPAQIIRASQEVNSSGYHPAQVGEPQRCTGCGICAVVCPDLAITAEALEKGQVA